VDMYYRTVSEFTAESSRLVGGAQLAHSSLVTKYRSKLVRTATTATDALMQTLKCTSSSSSSSSSSSGRGKTAYFGTAEQGEDEEDESNSAVQNPAGGFKDIWDMGDRATAAFITHTANSLASDMGDLLQRQQQEQEAGSSEEGAGATASLEASDRRHIRRVLGSVLVLARQVYAPRTAEAAAAESKEEEQEEQEEEGRKAVWSLVELQAVLDAYRSGDEEDDDNAMELTEEG
jgi:hypothetical protein